MKHFKLALFTAASLAVSTANAGIINYSGAIESWVVGTTGTYNITVEGAQGASDDFRYAGGRGASLSALFDLAAGDTYYFAVGGAGSSGNGNGGGGGGSFFVDALDNPLLVAGGGGGTRISVNQNGCDASITNFGITGSRNSPTSPCTVKTTDEGLGGIVSASSWGSAGAGFFGNGEVDNDSRATAAMSWANGLAGGADLLGGGTGGFGGGGSGAGSNGGGGGGGYSGGDGGRVAGGGGSFSAGIDTIALEGVGYGDGYASWELLTPSVSVPEPSTFVLLGLGLAGLGLSRRKTKT